MSDTHEQPDPFAGLAELRRSAIVGYDELEQATAKPVTWRWYGVFTDAHQTEISGPSGEGKTTFVSLLIAALAGHRPVSLLGREVEPIEQGRYVVIIEQENGTHSFRSRIQRACEALQLPAKATIDRMIFFIRQGIEFGDSRWRQLCMLSKRGLVGALIIDTRATVLTNGDSSKEEDQAKISRALMKMISEGRHPTIVLSHTPKSDKTNVSGSVQRKAGVDNLLIITGRRNPKTKKVESSVISFEKIRDDFLDHPLPIQFSLVERDGAWTVTHNGALTVEPLPQRILRKLSLGPLTAGAIRSEVGRSGADVARELGELVTRGVVIKQVGEVSGRERELYSLSPEAAESIGRHQEFVDGNGRASDSTGLGPSADLDLSDIIDETPWDE